MNPPAMPTDPPVWTMLDVLHAGAVVSGVSPVYNIEETTYALTAANPQFLMIMSSSMNAAAAAAAAKNAGIPQERVSPP